MAETLPSGIKKFESTDQVGMGAFNENWETIDTKLTTDATTLARGMMSAADKTKLNGIATGAQVNRSIATQAQAEAGTDNTTDMTPLRTKQAMDNRSDLNRSRGTVVTNGNFNDYTTIGIYSAGNISSSPNRPPVIADYGVLEVSREGAYLIQRYTEIISGVTYQRTNWDGSNWSAWKRVGRTEVSSSAPASPVNGDIWYDSNEHKFKGRANGAWV